jgi:hypothetical protein
MWTREVLLKHFGLTSTTAAPPRAALRKFGGPLDLSEFYGDDGTVFVELHCPPFVSFAMYAEVMRTKASETSREKVLQVNESDGIQQPLVRKDPIAQIEQTGSAPALLEYLAKRGYSLKGECTEEQKAVQAKSKKIVDATIGSFINNTNQINPGKPDKAQKTSKRAKKIDQIDASNKSRSLMSYAS